MKSSSYHQFHVMCLYKVLHKLCAKTLLSVGLNIVGDDVQCALNREMGKCFFRKTCSEYQRYIVGYMYTLATVILYCS